MIQLKLKSLNLKTLIIYTRFLQNVFYKLNTKVTCACLPSIKRRITLLKSPHVYKKAREQFELKTFKNVFTINTSKVSPQLFKFLFLNKPNTIKATLRRIV